MNMTEEQWTELRALVEGYTTDVALREGMTKEEAYAYWARFFHQGRQQARAALAACQAELAAMRERAEAAERYARSLEDEIVFKLHGDLAEIVEAYNLDDDEIRSDAHLRYKAACNRWDGLFSVSPLRALAAAPPAPAADVERAEIVKCASCFGYSNTVGGQIRHDEGCISEPAADSRADCRQGADAAPVEEV